MDEFVYASATTNFWSIELIKKLINYSSETNLEKKVCACLSLKFLDYSVSIQIKITITMHITALPFATGRTCTAG